MPEPQVIINNLWKHFGKITALPHHSGGEDPVREYVYHCAAALSDVRVKFYEADATDPGRRVIVLQKKPEQPPLFILQAHLDMVYTPPDMKFPLHLSDRDGWRSARDSTNRPSTLGADNGIGVAAALALLESDFNGGFECLFTVEEETTMGGAAAFDPGLLEARTLLNLDSEAVDTITYGCAGGLETNFRLPLVPEPVPPGTAYVELKISGLFGGHSATCINMGRLNAIKILTQCLEKLQGKYEFHLSHLNGGNAKNAIPMAASCGIIINEPDSTCFVHDLENICRKLKAQYQAVEPNLTHHVTRSLKPPPVMLNGEFARRLTETISRLPHGVIKMDPNLPAAVMTSNNLGTVLMDGANITISCFYRSSDPAELERVRKIIETIGYFYGWEISRGASFQPWVPNEASPILRLTREIYGPGAIMEVTHAGLECGHIYQKYNGAMDCVSIGPNIREPHSVNERVEINSVNLFVTRLLQIIDKIKQL